MINAIQFCIRRRDALFPYGKYGIDPMSSGEVCAHQNQQKSAPLYGAKPQCLDRYTLSHQMSMCMLNKYARIYITFPFPFNGLKYLSLHKNALHFRTHIHILASHCLGFFPECVLCFVLFDFVFTVIENCHCEALHPHIPISHTQIHLYEHVSHTCSSTNVSSHSCSLYVTIAQQTRFMKSNYIK